MNPFAHTALKLRWPAENLFLLVSRISTDDLVFWCSWHGCYGWSFLAVGVGFSELSSTCWFGLRTAELVAR